MARPLSSLWRKFKTRSSERPGQGSPSNLRLTELDIETTPTQQYDPIILSTSHLTTEQPGENFTEPSKGNCTWYSLISSPMTRTDTFTVGIGVCEPKNGTLAMHRHKQAEIYFVLCGSGTVKIEGYDYIVKTGDVVFIPGDAEHGVFNYGSEEFKWLYCFGVGSFQDVVYRFTQDQQT